MKNLNKIMLTLLVATILFTGNSQVSTVVEKRNPVLIDFTGMKCTPCGDLSIWLDDYVALNPETIVIAMHGSGSFATPSSPFDIDMRCDEAIATTANIAYTDGGVLDDVTSYPTVLIDGKKSSIAGISASATTVRNEDSFVNIDLQTSLNEATRELTINVELYFTADAPSEAFLNVGLLQDELFGYQLGQPGSVTGNFTFNHVLRDLVSSTFGNSLGTPSQGQTLSETFIYTIPNFIDYSATDLGQDPELLIGDLSIYAYVAANESVVVGGNPRTHHIIETGVYEHLESTASITDLDSDQSIYIWPNPSSVDQEVSISSETTISNATITITNVLGQKILVETGIELIANTPLNINTSRNLTQGNYIVLIEAENFKSYSKLIIQ